MKMNKLPPDVDEYAIGIEEYEDEKESEEGTISEDGEIIN
jgi:hypothetical protein